MRKHSFQAVSLSLSLLLVIISASSSPAQTRARPARTRRQQNKDVVLFDTTRYADYQIILPIVLMRGGRYVAPPSFNMKAARRRFSNTYYRPGQKYRLLFNGGEIGTVTVKNQEACDTTAARVEVQPPAAAENRALATNSDSLGGKRVEYRDLTETEKAALMKLVQPFFRRAKVDVPEFEGVSSGATAGDLDGDGHAELIGTFASGAKSQHTLFIIAEPHGNGFRPALLLFHPALDENGDNQVRRDFLDGLDLDGDGVSEAIVSVNDYRSPYDWNFVIYKKQGGRWRSIYQGGGMRCPEEGGGH